MKSKETSYVIFVPGTRGPSVAHCTLEEARAEARRLVELAGAAQAMVCQFIEGVEKVTSIKTLKVNPLPTDEDMPF